MSRVHCYFCGGVECKYENWKLWTGPELPPNAVAGLYSNWITDSILAMARPSTKLMEEYQLVRVFRNAGITAIVNLQECGEHEQCGSGIHASSGFSYLPESWMNAGVQYYNFGWPDMDIPNFTQMLSLVQVIAYTVLSNAGKVAVHCHAGLGRTGLTIACYLVYGEYMRATAAIQLVRKQRPGSVQTRRQVLFVQAFEEFLQPMRTLFVGLLTEFTPLFVCNKRPSWDEIMQRQTEYLHGDERRKLKHIPKVVFEVLNQLQRRQRDDASTAVAAVQALVGFEGISSLSRDALLLMRGVTAGKWAQLDSAAPQVLLEVLLWWLCSLEGPLLADSVLEGCSFLREPAAALQHMPKHTFQALAYILDAVRGIVEPEFTPQRSGLIRTLAIVLSNYRGTMLEHPFVFEAQPASGSAARDASAESAMLLLRLEDLKEANAAPSPSDEMSESGIQTQQRAPGVPGEPMTYSATPASPARGGMRRLASWASSLSIGGGGKSKRDQSSPDMLHMSLNDGASSRGANSPELLSSSLQSPRHPASRQGGGSMFNSDGHDHTRPTTPSPVGHPGEQAHRTALELVEPSYAMSAVDLTVSASANEALGPFSSGNPTGANHRPTSPAPSLLNVTQHHRAHVRGGHAQQAHQHPLKSRRSSPVVPRASLQTVEALLLVFWMHVYAVEPSPDSSAAGGLAQFAIRAPLTTELEASNSAADICEMRTDAKAQATNLAESCDRSPSVCSLPNQTSVQVFTIAPSVEHLDSGSGSARSSGALTADIPGQPPLADLELNHSSAHQHQREPSAASAVSLPGTRWAPVRHRVSSVSQRPSSESYGVVASDLTVGPPSHQHSRAPSEALTFDLSMRTPRLSAVPSLHSRQSSNDVPPIAPIIDIGSSLPSNPDAV